MPNGGLIPWSEKLDVNHININQLPGMAAFDRCILVYFFLLIEGGGFVVGASSLTGRYWTGSVWFWKDTASVPDIEKCTTACEVDSGIGDLTVIDETHIILATDSG